MKIEFLTAYGAFDSHKEDSPNRETAGKPYDVISLDEIIELALSGQRPPSRASAKNILITSLRLYRIYIESQYPSFGVF